jgi:formamidopyrimidine-DNA glycosylase
MPELPEVEITKRAISSHLVKKKVLAVSAFTEMLRLPLMDGLDEDLHGRTLLHVERRGKYLLFRFDPGTIIIHLGMSGSIRIETSDTSMKKHDHLALSWTGGLSLRLNDPRRFGLVVWASGDPLQHPLLKGLGPEPLGDGFDGEYLFRRSRGRELAVKRFIMDSHTVAGVGNIYANESLFHAGIHPGRSAGNISQARYHRLAEAIREVLTRAIDLGEKKLKRWQGKGEIPTRFPLILDVYGKDGEPCNRCRTPISQIRMDGRSTYFCRKCQR